MTSGIAKLDQRVELLCQDGCRAVRDYIEALQAGQLLPQFADLDMHERELLLRELQAIMSVYGDSCSL